MEHVYMQPPGGGEPKLVPAVPEELIPLYSESRIIPRLGASINRIGASVEAHSE